MRVACGRLPGLGAAGNLTVLVIDMLVGVSLSCVGRRRILHLPTLRLKVTSVGLLLASDVTAMTCLGL